MLLQFIFHNALFFCGKQSRDRPHQIYEFLLCMQQENNYYIVQYHLS